MRRVQLQLARHTRTQRFARRSPPSLERGLSSQPLQGQEEEERHWYDVGKSVAGPAACATIGVDQLGITKPTTIRLADARLAFVSTRTRARTRLEKSTQKPALRMNLGRRRKPVVRQAAGARDRQRRGSHRKGGIWWERGVPPRRGIIYQTQTRLERFFSSVNI